MGTFSLRRAQASRPFRKLTFHFIFVFLLTAGPAGTAHGTQTGAENANNIANTGAMNDAFDLSKLLQQLSNMNMEQGMQNQSQGAQTQNQAQMMQGMMQMAMAAMQALMSMLSAMAGQKAGDNANKSGQNAGNLGSMGKYASTLSATSPTPNSPNGSGTSGDPATANIDQAGSNLQIDPIAKVLEAMEKNYGIKKDDAIKALQNGMSPKDILANAPKNAPSADLLDKLSDKLNGQIASKALGAAERIAGGAGLASKTGDTGMQPTGASASGEEAAAAGAKVRLPSSTAPDLEVDIPGDVSPEVRAALAAKKAAQLQAERDKFTDPAGWTLFQLVHNRYQKVGPMLYGRVEVTNLPAVPVQLR